MKKWQVGNEKVFLKEDLFLLLEAKIQNMKAVVVQNGNVDKKISPKIFIFKDSFFL